MSLPTLRIIAFILGIFLITLAVSMLIPMLTLLLYSRTDDLNAFLWSSLVTAAAGIAMVIPGRPKEAQLRPRDMYLLTTGSWLVVCIFAALPMVLIHHISYTDAFFQTESSGWGEKVMPRSHMAAKYILFIYLSLTLSGFLGFWLAGMTPFDAINHAMTSIATGGYSTSDSSLANWSQPAVHWVAVVLMICGGLPFTLYVATLRGNRKALFKDHQVRGFLGFLLATWLVFGTWLWLHSDNNWLDAFRIVAVNVTSVITTTGFALGDYTTWGSFAVLLFFYLTFVGGC